MRAFLIVIASLLALVIAPTAAQAAPKGKLVVDYRINHADVVFQEPEGVAPNERPDVGELLMGSGVVFKKGTTRKVGTVQFVQMVTSVRSIGSETEPPDLTTLGYSSTKLKGGTIFTMGEIGADPDVIERGSIVGGTGKYRGARGDVLDTILEFEETHQLARSTFRFTR